MRLGLSAATQASPKRTIQNAEPKNNLPAYGYYLHQELERVKKIVDAEARDQEDGVNTRPLPPSKGHASTTVTGPSRLINWLERGKATSNHIPDATWEILAHTCSLIFRKDLELHIKAPGMQRT